MVSWRDAFKREMWKVGTYVDKDGNAQTTKIGEVEEYKYLGVWFRVRGRMFSKNLTMLKEKAIRVGAIVRNFSREGCNRSICAKAGWEKVALPSVLYGMEVVDVTKSWIREVEKEQMKMSRFILGSGKGASCCGMRGLLGWYKLEDRVNCAFLSYVRRFEWSKECWGRVIWEWVKNNKGTNWWRRVCKLAEEYEVDLEWQCMNINAWKNYVKRKVYSKAVRDWLEEGRQKLSLKFFALSEEDFGRLLPLDGSEGAKFLARLQIGDVYKWCVERNWVSEEDDCCLICEEKGEKNIEHLILRCEGVDNERRAILNSGIDNFNEWENRLEEANALNSEEVTRVGMGRMLLGLEGVITGDGWYKRMTWAKKIANLVKKKLEERNRIENGCTNTLYIVVERNEGEVGRLVEVNGVEEVSENG
jgi:hypothetical protein